MMRNRYTPPPAHPLSIVRAWQTLKVRLTGKCPVPIPIEGDGVLGALWASGHRELFDPVIMENSDAFVELIIDGRTFFRESPVVFAAGWYSFEGAPLALLSSYSKSLDSSEPLTVWLKILAFQEIVR